MIKGSVQEEDIALININTLKTAAPKYTKQTLKDIKGETDNNTMRVGNFNTIVTSVNI